MLRKINMLFLSFFISSIAGSSNISLTHCKTDSIFFLHISFRALFIRNIT